MMRNNHATPLSPGRRAARHGAIRVPALVAFLLVRSVAVNAQQIPPGVVVYSHEDSGLPDPSQRFWNIWSLDAQNPASQVQITAFTAAPVVTSTPVWKKDFTRAIAFQFSVGSDPLNLTSSDLYVVGADRSYLVPTDHRWA
jgi:hypothetical protein